MIRATLSATGYVLSRDLTSGGYERLALISGECGYLRVMRRPSAKTANDPVPDLFDFCTVSLQSRQGGAWFLGEYEVLKRFSGIGARYDALEAASAWAGLAVANAPELESCAAICDISSKIFDALDRGAPPQSALLKALFLFARGEGLPVSEEWIVGLSAVQRKTAETVLRFPLNEEASAASNLPANDLAALNRDIAAWMCRNHNIVPAANRASGD